MDFNRKLGFQAHSFFWVVSKAISNIIYFPFHFSFSLYRSEQIDNFGLKKKKENWTPTIFKSGHADSEPLCQAIIYLLDKRFKQVDLFKSSIKMIDKDHLSSHINIYCIFIFSVLLCKQVHFSGHFFLIL